MFQLVPLASTFQDPRDTKRVVGEIGARLARHGLDHVVVESGEPLSGGHPVVLLTVTGGTEHKVMERAMEFDGPVLIAAHPSSNSFPAALEILARLRQLGRKGKIVMLGERDEEYQVLHRLLRAVRTHRLLAQTTLGVLGAPSDWLIASPTQEEAEGGLFSVGLERVPMEEIMEAMERVDEEEVHGFQEQFVKGAAQVVEPNAQDLLMAGKVYAATKEVMENHALTACTMRCFDLVTSLKTTGCLALSALTDEGLIAGCEGDIPTTITMLFLSLLTGEVPFMANPQEIDPETNTLWVAHCTVARRLLTKYTLRSHYESGLGVGIQGTMAPQKITLARIGGRDLSQLFVANGEVLENGEDPERCRTQLKLKIDESVDYFLSNPLGNHHVLIPGHHKKAILEYYNLYR